MSWTQILLIVVIGVFLLGPERIPVAVQWVFSSLRKVREMATGAQQQLHSEFGGEIAELRRQVSELQSLRDMKELQELRQLRDLHPKNLISRGIFGDAPAPSSAGGALGINPGEAKSLFAAPDTPGPSLTSMVKPDPIKPVSAGAPEPVPAAAAPDPLPGAVHPTPAQQHGAGQQPVPDPLPSSGVPVADPAPAAGASQPGGDPLPSVAAAAAPAGDPLPLPRG
nr:Sec-independent protein translocase protein TatB [Nakamurella aerolata]